VTFTLLSKENEAKIPEEVGNAIQQNESCNICGSE